MAVFLPSLYAFIYSDTPEISAFFFRLQVSLIHVPQVPTSALAQALFVSMGPLVPTTRAELGPLRYLSRQAETPKGL